MLKNLLTNWKTTSAGLTMIIGATVHLVFAIKSHAADENTWTTSLLAIAGGCGLIFAGDGSSSASNHSDTLNELANIKQAITSGDTSVLNKPVAPQPPKP